MTRVGVLNPLPGLLAHFENAIVDNLEYSSGIEAVRFEVHGTEMPDGAGQRDRMSSGVRLIREARQQIAGSGVTCIINLWPTFGYLEPLIWRSLRLRAPVWSILHDVTPLRPQFGYWPQATGPLRLGREGRHGWIVHTEAAREEAHQLGLGNPVVIPHPILPSPAQSEERDLDVLVFGQFKPARDLSLLERIGERLEKNGLRGEIVGRGWPEVAGWHVRNEFIHEDEVTPLLGGAKALLLPYVHYYQSGVALRAIEVGTPVVGMRNEFLEGYLGPKWPCFVEVDDTDAWMAGIDAAIATAASPGAMELAMKVRGGIADAWCMALHEKLVAPRSKSKP